jgi:hypothetical protein
VSALKGMIGGPGRFTLWGKTSRYPMNKSWVGHRGDLDVIETLWLLLAIDPQFLAF